MKNDDGLLDDLAPKRKERIIKKKKFHSNKGVTVEVAARRSAALESAQENPLPKLQKDAILMKYGVTTAVVERNIGMPKWKGEQIRQRSERPVGVVWNSMMQDWFKVTKGLVVPQRRQGMSEGKYANQNRFNRTTVRPLNRPRTFAPKHEV
jgi:hypothetical protein